MRHGESKSQAKQIEQNAPDSINGLTETGIAQVQATAKSFNNKIDAVYSSPYLRTQQTAQLFLDNLNIKLPINIDKRLREIDYGVFGIEDKNNPEMIAVATKQIAGDYDVRFGKNGENKREIVTRFFDFLLDVFNKQNKQDSVLVITHGRAISIVIGDFCMANNLPIMLDGTKNAQIKEIELNEKTITNIIHHLSKINQH